MPVTNIFFEKWYKSFYNIPNLNNTTDGSNDVSGLRSLTKFTNPKQKLQKLENSNIMDELSTSLNNNCYSWNFFNESRNYRFKDPKSSNLQFLSPDKNLRLVPNKFMGSTNRDLGFSTNTNLLLHNVDRLDFTPHSHYKYSLMDWGNKDVLRKVLSTNLTTPGNHNPIFSGNSN